MRCASVGNHEKAMGDAISETHRALFAKGEADPALHGLGATLSVLWLLADGRYIVGHVGDSRIYRYGAGAWEQITIDHSVGAGMVRRGEITAEAGARLKFRGLLEQVMGGDGAALEPQVLGGHWDSSSEFVLCSDGLYGPLKEQLVDQLKQAQHIPNLELASRSLIDAANAEGGPDNITVVLARFLPKS